MGAAAMAVAKEAVARVAVVAAKVAEGWEAVERVEAVRGAAAMVEEVMAAGEMAAAAMAMAVGVRVAGEKAAVGMGEVAMAAGRVAVAKASPEAMGGRAGRRRGRRARGVARARRLAHERHAVLCARVRARPSNVERVEEAARPKHRIDARVPPVSAHRIATAR